MPFKYKGQLHANQDRVLVRQILKASTAFTIGDSVKMENTSNRLILSGAGGPTFGILAGFEKADGSPVTDDGAGGAPGQNYTTPANNTVLGVIDISLSSKYSVPLDAARGTTGNSACNGSNFDVVAASDVLDESTIADPGATATFCVLESDPDPTAPANSVICVIQESQLKI